MTSARPLFLVLLIASTVGAVAFAWNRHLKVLDLALTAEQLRLEQTELRAQLRDAQQNNGFNVTLAPDLPDSDETDLTEVPVNDETVGESRREIIAEMRQRQERGMLARMQDPAFQAQQIARARANLDTRYADLFRRLNLPPAQLEQLKSLLVERDTAAMDVMAAAVAAGINPREDGRSIGRLINQAQNEINASIEQVLGPEAYANLQTYQQTAPQRQTVSQLEQRLSYTATPLTAAQSEQLVNVLARTASTGDASGQRGTTFRPGGPVFNFGNAPLTDEAIAQAAGILAPAQLDALRELQAAQAAASPPGRSRGNQAVPAVRLPGGGG